MAKDSNKQAFKFVKKLAKVILKDKPDINKKELWQCFVEVTRNIDNSNLRDVLTEKKYFVIFRREVKRIQYPTSIESVQHQHDQRVEEEKISQERKPAKDVPSKAPLYNLYAKRCPQASDIVTEENNTEVACNLLSKKLPNLGDEVHQFLDILSQTEDGLSVEFPWQPITNKLKMLCCCCRNPDVLLSVMSLYLKLTKTEVDELLDNRKTHRVRVFCEDLKSFLNFCHTKIGFLQLSEPEAKEEYETLLVELLSLYVDMFLISKKKNIKVSSQKLCSLVCFLTESSGLSRLDILLRLRTPNKENGGLLVPFIKKSLMIPSADTSMSNKLYLKYMLIIRKYAGVLGDLLEKQAQAARTVRPRKDFLSWLSKTMPDAHDEFPSTNKFKGLKITRFILDEASPKTISILQMDTSQLSDETGTHVISEKDTENAIKTSGVIPDMFFLDKLGQNSEETNKKSAFQTIMERRQATQSGTQSHTRTTQENIEVVSSVKKEKKKKKIQQSIMGDGLDSQNSVAQSQTVTVQENNEVVSIKKKKKRKKKKQKKNDVQDRHQEEESATLNQNEAAIANNLEEKDITSTHTMTDIVPADALANNGDNDKKISQAVMKENRKVIIYQPLFSVSQRSIESTSSMSKGAKLVRSPKATPAAENINEAFDIILDTDDEDLPETRLQLDESSFIGLKNIFGNGDVSMERVDDVDAGDNSENMLDICIGLDSKISDAGSRKRKDEDMTEVKSPPSKKTKRLDGPAFEENNNADIEHPALNEVSPDTPISLSDDSDAMVIDVEEKENKTSTEEVDIIEPRITRSRKTSKPFADDSDSPSAVKKDSSIISSDSTGDVEVVKPRVTRNRQKSLTVNSDSGVKRKESSAISSDSGDVEIIEPRTTRSRQKSHSTDDESGVVTKMQTKKKQSSVTISSDEESFMVSDSYEVFPKRVLSSLSEIAEMDVATPEKDRSSSRLSREVRSESSPKTKTKSSSPFASNDLIPVDISQGGEVFTFLCSPIDMSTTEETKTNPDNAASPPIESLEKSLRKSPRKSVKGISSPMESSKKSPIKNMSKEIRDRIGSPGSSISYTIANETTNMESSMSSAYDTPNESVGRLDFLSPLSSEKSMGEEPTLAVSAGKLRSPRLTDNSQNVEYMEEQKITHSRKSRSLSKTMSPKKSVSSPIKLGSSHHVTSSPEPVFMDMDEEQFTHLQSSKSLSKTKSPKNASQSSLKEEKSIHLSSSESPSKIMSPKRAAQVSSKEIHTSSSESPSKIMSPKRAAQLSSKEKLTRSSPSESPSKMTSPKKGAPSPEQFTKLRNSTSHLGEEDAQSGKKDINSEMASQSPQKRSSVQPESTLTPRHSRISSKQPKSAVVPQTVRETRSRRHSTSSAHGIGGASSPKRIRKSPVKCDCDSPSHKSNCSKAATNEQEHSKAQKVGKQFETNSSDESSKKTLLSVIEMADICHNVKTHTVCTDIPESDENDEDRLDGSMLVGSPKKLKSTSPNKCADSAEGGQSPPEKQATVKKTDRRHSSGISLKTTPSASKKKARKSMPASRKPLKSPSSIQSPKKYSLRSRVKSVV